MGIINFGVLVFLGLLGHVISDELPQPCEHPIYCLGGENSLLHVVQMARLYNDSKTFVDKPTRYDQAMVLYKFEQMMTVSSSNIQCKQHLISWLSRILIVDVPFGHYK